MNFFQSLPPPPQLPPPLSTTVNGGGDDVTQPQLSNTLINPDVIAATSSSPPSPTSSSPSSSIIIITIVISSAIILSATIYLLLRFLSRRLQPAPVDRHVPPPPSSGERCIRHGKTRLDSLPLFKFGALAGNLTGAGGGDCAVCLSKFQSDDQLRLLPLCCHVFHAPCIDTWLSHNMTCPLCRSTVYSSDADVLNKLPSISRQNQNSNGDSFRIEMGSISRRRHPPSTTTSAAADLGSGGGRRSYSIGSFEYILSDNFEIPLEVTSAEKEFPGGGGVVAPPGESLAAAEYGGSGRNWLKDYVERLGSLSISSGRFFTRNDVVVPVDDEDLEANLRVGEEISELFRWISGV